MKKLLCLLACSLGLAAAATGCAMSPERLCTRVQQAVAETPATSADMETDITMTFTDPETGIQVDADGSYQITSRVTRDPKASQLSMDAQVEVMGVTVPVTVESYTLVEDGMLTTYTGIDGLWQRFTAQDIDLQEAAPLWEQPADQLTIDREQDTWNDIPVYCLTGSIPGAQMSDFLHSLMESMTSAADSGAGGQADAELWQAMEQMDLSGVTVDVRTMIDAESYLPLKQKTTIHGMDQAMASVWEALTDGMEIGMPEEYTVTIRLGYDEQEPIILPEEAPAVADRYERLQEGNSDNGDGTYTIQESGVYLDVRPPAGYTVTQNGYDSVSMAADDDDRVVVYQLYICQPGDDMTMLPVNDEYYLSEQGYFVFRTGAQTLADGVWMDMMYITDYPLYDQLVTYLCTRITTDEYGNSYWLLVTVFDGGYTRDTLPEGLVDVGSYFDNVALADLTSPSAFGGDASVLDLPEGTQAI